MSPPILLNNTMADRNQRDAIVNGKRPPTDFGYNHQRINNKTPSKSSSKQSKSSGKNGQRKKASTSDSPGSPGHDKKVIYDLMDRGSNFRGDKFLSEVGLFLADSLSTQRPVKTTSPTSSMGSTSTASSSAASTSSWGTNQASLFTRRSDYSSFNLLPRTKINPYHIRTEEDSSHGSDELRTLILSTLSANGKTRAQCVLCENEMVIFERFPLVDGTFFLSPRQHTPSAVPLLTMNSPSLSFLHSNSSDRKYLHAVCMGCLEGWSCTIRCRSCRQRWNGSHLILGTMYSYDIFAAASCCSKRRQCSKCGQGIQPNRLSYFSDYSQSFPCSFCRAKDYHFVRPLPDLYTRTMSNILQPRCVFFEEDNEEKKI